MGEANFNYDYMCCYKFDVFFDTLSHLVDTIWTNWARLWLAWALWGWGRAQNSLPYICIPYLPPLPLLWLLARL